MITTIRATMEQRQDMSMLRIQRAGNGSGPGWELHHVDAGYLLPLTYRQMLAVIRNEFDVSGLLRGRLERIGGDDCNHETM